MPDKTTPTKPPAEEPRDRFRALVHACIETFEDLPNDSMCLDYNRVEGRLRAMVLNDAEYRRETRNIYARQKLEELSDLDRLIKSGLDGEDVGEDEDTDPRNREKKRKSVNSDKETISLRFKAAQVRREVLESLEAANGTAEKDAVNLMMVSVTKEELAQALKNELFEGDADESDALGELTETKEAVPEGSSGRLRTKGRAVYSEDEDYFDVLPSGEIIER